MRLWPSLNLSRWYVVSVLSLWMRQGGRTWCFGLVAIALWGAPAYHGSLFGQGREKSSAVEPPIPVAVLPFQCKTESDAGRLVAESLTVFLSNSDSLLLVERSEIEKIFAEAKLNLTGLVSRDEAIQIGRLTGAQLLVTGSILDTGNQRYLIAKIISSETSRVLGASVKADRDSDLVELSQQMAERIHGLIEDRGSELVATPIEQKDLVAELTKQLKKLGDAGKDLPTIVIHVEEQHLPRTTIDPAVQTQLESTLAAAGFPVVTASKAHHAQLVLEGEGISEFGTRHAELFSVRARVELRLTDRATGQVLFSDSQVAWAIDLSDAIAGKSALQAASQQILQRNLEPLVKWIQNAERR